MTLTFEAAQWQRTLRLACHEARMTGVRHRVYRGLLYWHFEPVTVSREVSP